MTEQEINVAIAEVLGWKDFAEVGFQFSDNCGKLTGTKDGDVFEPIPDYHGDLNAMHEAEKTLTDEQTKRLYVDHLVCLMKRGEFTVMADAARRAEAFLRTISKWTDGRTGK